MENRGEKVKDLLNSLGIKIKSIAPILNKSESYTYVLLERRDLNWEIIRKIGDAINYDFRKIFPDMPVLTTMYESERKRYKNAEEEALYWKEKYFSLMEDNAEYIQELKSKIPQKEQ